MQNKHHLISLVYKLENRLPDWKLFNLSVSNSTVGWQIEHSLLTINAIIEALIKSNPTDYQWRFSFPRIIVFTLKYIPRGRAKSPDIVQPANNITIESIRRNLLFSKEKIKKLDTLNQDKFFEHPYFGKLKLTQAIRFLEIHTNHHIKIIDDICSK